MENEKCFCHFGGYQVKDAVSRADIEALKGRADNLEESAERTAEEIKRLEESAAIAATDLVLISDSYGHPEASGGTSWQQYTQQYMQDRNVLAYYSGGKGFGWGAGHEHYFPDYMETIPGSTAVKDVLILCGANDGNLLQLKLSTAAEIENGIAAAAPILREKFPNAKISLGFVGRHKVSEDIGTNVFTYYYDACEVYKRCTKYGLYFADGFQYVLHNLDLIEDSDLHPNQAGSERIAHYAMEYIAAGHINVVEVYKASVRSGNMIVTINNGITNMHYYNNGDVGVGVNMDAPVAFGDVIELGSLACPTFNPTGAYGAIGCSGTLYASYADTSGANLQGTYYMVANELYFKNFTPGKSNVNVKMACFKSVDITCPTMFC